MRPEQEIGREEPFPTIMLEWGLEGVWMEERLLECHGVEDIGQSSLIPGCGGISSRHIHRRTTIEAVGAVGKARWRSSSKICLRGGGGC